MAEGAGGSRGVVEESRGVVEGAAESAAGIE